MHTNVCCLRWASHHVAAVDMQNLAGDEARGIARQVGACGGDLVDVADTAHRYLLHPLAIAVAELWILAPVARGIDQAG